MAYCYRHGIDYASFTCPRCEANERSERLEEALREQGDAAQRRAQELEEALRDQHESALEVADRYANPGEYECPHCLYRTLKAGSTRCVKCHGTIDAPYWQRVREREEAARVAARERAQRAREAAEAAAVVQQEVDSRASRWRIVWGGLLVGATALAIAVSQRVDERDAPSRLRMDSASASRPLVDSLASAPSHSIVLAGVQEDSDTVYLNGRPQSAVRFLALQPAWYRLMVRRPGCGTFVQDVIIGIKPSADTVEARFHCGDRFEVPVGALVHRGACPDREGCRYGAWVAQTWIPVFASDDSTSDVIDSIPPGGPVLALHGHVLTLVPGIFVVGRDSISRQYAGGSGDSSWVTMKLRAGDTLLTFTNHGEGVQDVYWSGALMQVHLGFEGTIVREPTYAWWVFISSRHGRGWIRGHHGVIVPASSER